MKVIKQNTGMRESIYSVEARDTNVPLVVVKNFEGKPAIDATTARSHLTVYEAAEYAQALLIAIQIVDDLNNGRAIEVDESKKSPGKA